MADVPKGEISTEERLIERIRELEGRLEARRSIEQAKGILAGQGLTEEEAYSRMRRASMDRRKPLSEIAEAVIVAASLRR